MIDVEKLKKLHEDATANDMRAAIELVDYLFANGAAILALAEREKRMREALEHCAECDPECAMFAAKALGEEKAI